MKKYLIIFLVFILLGAGGFYYYRNISDPSSSSTSSNVYTPDNGVQITPESEEILDIEVIAENLEIPWEVEFLPSGEILVTERPGRLLKIQDKSVIEVSGVRHIGEGGLMGMALHPNYEENHLIYLYLTSEENGKIVNRVERYQLDGNSLTNRDVIVDGILGSSVHDGGRIHIGSDGYLYIGTGDAGQERLSQDRDSLNGKILRVKDDGSIPEDNPFGNEVYSYGHRNVQGLAWDAEGRLWATEHGRSGVRSGFDELNLVEKGKNYGWPEIQGDEENPEMVKPIIHSGPNETWAPSGAAFVDGSIFFVGLRGSALYQAKLNGSNVENLTKHFDGEYGRLRGVRLGPDGFLYITTSNTDGRGRKNQGDDKLIKINPKIFN